MNNKIIKFSIIAFVIAILGFELLAYTSERNKENDAFSSKMASTKQPHQGAMLTGIDSPLMGNTILSGRRSNCVPTKLSDEDARILLYASPIAWQACCENKSSDEIYRNELIVLKPTTDYPVENFLIAKVVNRKSTNEKKNVNLENFIVDKRTGIVKSMSDLKEIKDDKFSKIQTWMRDEHCLQEDGSQEHFESMKSDKTHNLSIENKYFYVRDKYIKHFVPINKSISEALTGKTMGEQDQILKSQPLGRYEYAVLMELEDLISKIIGKIKVEGFQEKGTINLQTLVEELGFGMVDGLKYSQKNFDRKMPLLFVTTKSLLSKYIENNPGYPKELSQLADTGILGSQTNFYSQIIDQDASISNYMNLPIKPAKGQTFARAYIGIISQDIVPSFPPYQIFVFVSRKDKVYIYTVATHTHIEQIAKCKAISDDLWKKSEEVTNENGKPNLNDSNRYEQSEKYEEQSFLEYQQCFSREASKQKFFAPLMTEVQAIVNKI